MSSERVIRELAELFKNPANLQNDMAEGFELMREHIHKKYMKKLIKIVEDCEEKAAKNPPDEVKLLKAIKPFTAADSHDKIENFIELFNRISTFSQVRNHFGSAEPIQIKAASYPNNPSVHHDGVYDVDENCIVNRQRQNPVNENNAGMLILAAMLSKRQ